jgi:TetR/AcrR family transcriptional regulator
MQARAKRTAPRRRTATGGPPRPTATRDRIVEAALEAFADSGFDGATTRDIAAAAGVNQGLITYHFAGKEELWKATVEHVFGELRASFAALQILQDVDPLTRLRLSIRQFVRFTAAHPELHRLMVQEGKSDGPRQRWLVDRHIKPLFELTVEMIRQAQRDGLLIDIPAPHLHYLFLGAAAHVFVVAPEFRRLTGEDPMKPESVEAHADALIELMMRRSPK